MMKHRKNNLNIRLKDADQELNELVVVGYGTQKVNLTGAVGQIDAKRWKQTGIRCYTGDTRRYRT